MMGTITPVVYGQSKQPYHWGTAIGLHVIGTVSSSVLVGFTLGLAGWLVGLDKAPWTTLMLGMLGVFSCLYALHEVRMLALPYPQRRQQVDGVWRYRFHPYLVAWLYGLGLGTGFSTFVAVATLYIVAAAALVSADPMYAAILFGSFGLARALFLFLVGRKVGTPEQSERVLRRMTFVSQLIHVVNGLALAWSGAFVVTTFLRLVW